MGLWIRVHVGIWHGVTEACPCAVTYAKMKGACQCTKDSSPYSLRLQRSFITEDIRSIAITLRLFCLNVDHGCTEVRLLQFGEV